MGWSSVAAALVALQVISFLLPAAEGDFLSPLFSPLINETCKIATCGKGHCQVSMSHAFGFVCECDAGWRQLHIDDNLRFLPCVVPNCTLNYSCSNISLPPTPSPSPASTSNKSILNPCFWSFCGGGSCTEISMFEHRCDCQEDYSNLLNISSLPCFRDCSLGADCNSLGIPLSNASSPSSSPSFSLQGSSSVRDYSVRKNLLLWFFLAASLAMVQGTH